LCRWAFEEIRSIAEMKFRFSEEEDACEYVTRLAADMQIFDPAHVLKVGMRLQGHRINVLLQRQEPQLPQPPLPPLVSMLAWLSCSLGCFAGANTEPLLFEHGSA
jgi:hypothetical protein